MTFPPGSGPPVRLHGIFNRSDLFKALDNVRAAT